MPEALSGKPLKSERDPTTAAGAMWDSKAVFAGRQTVSLVASDFHGRWDVRRTIVDHLSGTVHRFAGEAVISADDFVEAGKVCHGDVSFSAERRYVLRPGADGMADGVTVAFADGRPFIGLAAQASQAVRHLCGADDYRGRFFFRNGNAWVEAWRVTGPRKRYASLAHYNRQAL